MIIVIMEKISVILLVSVTLIIVNEHISVRLLVVGVVGFDNYDN